MIRITYFLHIKTLNNSSFLILKTDLDSFINFITLQKNEGNT